MSTMLDHVSAAFVEFEKSSDCRNHRRQHHRGLARRRLRAHGLRHGVCHCAVHKREAVVWRCSRAIRATDFLGPYGGDARAGRAVAVSVTLCAEQIS